ncbi:MAG: FG-GAP-like repeat-containing protein [Rubripirellula sp.]
MPLIHSLRRTIVCLVLLAGCTDRTPAPTTPTPGLPSQSAKANPPAADGDGNSSPPSTTDLLSQARRDVEVGELESAAGKVNASLLAKPDDMAALFLAAEIAARRGLYADAVELLDEIPRDDPEAGLAALGQSADWSMRGKSWQQAEVRYEEILKRIPQAGMAHRRLAYLFNRQGRRQEASEHVRELCRAGDVTQTELHTLVNETDAVFDEGNDQADSLESYVPIGPAAEARVLFSANDFKAALELLKKPMELRQLDAAGSAFFGRLAMEVQDEESMARWFDQLAVDQQEFTDHWVAIGTWLLNEGDVKGATRSFAEAVMRNPTDWITFTRLETCMGLSGQTKLQEAYQNRATLLRKSVLASNRIAGEASPKQADIEELATVLDALSRPVEAVMWRAIGLSYSGGGKAQMAALNAQLKELTQRDSKSADLAFLLAGLPVDAYPLPSSEQIKISPVAPIANRQIAKALSPSLVDVASSVGVVFQYHNAITPKLRDLQLYEQFGGGAVAFDFDCDGFVDLYFNQGGADPKEKVRGQSNALFRNLGERYMSIDPATVGVDDQGYGQGVTAGDWNQDGFVDLVVANFGVNTLLINNGDGTFRKQEFNDKSWQADRWTASIALADVTSDGLPDIVEVNYVNDAAVHEVSPRGENGRFVRFKGPESYQAGGDRIFTNEGDGTWRGVELGGDSEASHGLGIVITDLDGVPGNEMFVANDTDPNQLWFLQKDSKRQAPVFVDLAGLRGCAFSGRGGSGASMGIATGDFDRSGTIDLHVTNFFNESVHLYSQEPSHAFRDQAIKFDLYQPSMQVLGFGTQAFDYDNNGSLDIAVLNGHIDDLEFKGSPHKMAPQLFKGLAGQFELADNNDLGGYWLKPSIGRGLLRLDWNRDGRIDLVATHHDVPVALLQNRTETKHHWLQLQLVGTSSERDAIGARVSVRTGGTQVLVEVVTAGDGYSCKNESVLAFGLGKDSQVESVEVQWPRGDRQVFTVAEVDRRYLLVEGSNDSFALSP